MKVDRILFFISVTLISIGAVFSLSLSSFVTLAYDYQPLHFFVRQVIVGVFGVTLMWILSQFKPELVLNKIGFILFAGAVILMLFMPLLPSSIVGDVNGASRWIKLPGFSFAPVEFFKIGFIYFLAWSFTRRIDKSAKRTIKQEMGVLLPYLVVFGAVVYIIAIMQNDLGQVIVLGLTFVMMAILAGTSVRLAGVASLILVSGVAYFIISAEHRILRMKMWLAGIQKFFPGFENFIQVDNVNEAYQTKHSLNAINNGGIFGQGLGQGDIKLGFLSDVHTDFILAGISEELGFVGICLVCLIFYVLLFRIFKISTRVTDRVHYLFCAGVGFLFFFSFVINSYGISSITPVKGIAVPFLSYGGSHLLAACVAVGMVLMVSKRSE